MPTAPVARGRNRQPTAVVATTGAGLFAVYGLIVTAAIGVGSYLTLRRTVV